MCVKKNPGIGKKNHTNRGPEKKREVKRNSGGQARSGSSQGTSLSARLCGSDCGLGWWLLVSSSKESLLLLRSLSGSELVCGWREEGSAREEAAAVDEVGFLWRWIILARHSRKNCLDSSSGHSSRSCIMKCWSDLFWLIWASFSWILLARRASAMRKAVSALAFLRSLSFFLWKSLSSILRFSALTPGGWVQRVVVALRPTVCDLVGSELSVLPGVGVGLLATETALEVPVCLCPFFAWPFFATFWNFTKVLRKDQACS